MTTAPTSGVHDVLADEAVHTVFQPIVDLATGSVVAHEALSRGPVGPLESPDALFGAAGEAGLLGELDAACRTSAFSSAVRHGLVAPLSVFVNVEPSVLDSAPLDDLVAIAATAPGELRIVLEITERAVSARPAELLRTVERVREAGWGVALDDVGAEADSLAFMALLRPDVVKLDMALVQGDPDQSTAEVMHAVNAYAERSGARVLAEGIETEAHLTNARALGASLGQGWMFGRPTDQPDRTPPRDGLTLRPSRELLASELAQSPFAALPDGTGLLRSPKRLLIELSKQLEREASRLGDTCVVAATFQEARHFTAATAERYRELVDRTAFVCALGEGLPLEPLPGVRGATLSEDDPVRGEWDIVVLSPHFSTALLARDLGDDGPDMDRMFEYVLTYQRDVVVDAAQALIARVAPRLG
jgi:EAL domain-containing protein (putative c-di-GMP-specific phosphodiesterase class I)